MCISCGLDTKLRKREQYFINVALEESKKSTLYHKHGACLVYKNKIISTGYNFAIHNGPNYTIHAEVSAILEFLKNGPRKRLNKNILKDCILYVVRVGKESMNYPLKISRPCNNCYNFMKKYGIKKVYWSMNDEVFDDIIDEDYYKDYKYNHN